MNTLTQEQVAQIIGATGHIIGQRTHKRANGGAIEIVTTKTKARSELYGERRLVTPTVKDRVADDGYES